jgi:fructose-1,6-bisphosphatase/inositol monophosphatase family enzyme
MIDTDSGASDDNRELASFAQNLAERAGTLIKKLREERSFREFTKDGGVELVTSADLASNDILREATSRQTPDAQYF